MKPKHTPVKQFPMRLDLQLHAWLVEWAKREERSLHAQIVWILRRAAEGDQAQQAQEHHE